MREIHITELLDDRPLAGLDEQEIANVEIHVAGCADCKRAYDAARISAALIAARASETIEVGPFFKTRVMATLNERRLSHEAPALIRMWRAAGALASTMVALVMILVAVTIFTGSPDSRIQSEATTVPLPTLSQNIYSPEYVVMEQGDLDDDSLAYDEVIATMYELEDADGQ